MVKAEIYLGEGSKGLLAWLDKLMDEISKQDKVGPSAAVKKHLQASVSKVEDELAKLRKRYPVESERPANIKKLITRLEKTKETINKTKV